MLQLKGKSNSYHPGIHGAPQDPLGILSDWALLVSGLDLAEEDQSTSPTRRSTMQYKSFIAGDTLVGSASRI